jgi:hypothetical protein
MRKIVWLALIALALVAGNSHAEEVPVSAIDYCSGCASGNLGLNFEGESESVTLQAIALVQDDQGVWRGLGSFEVRSGASGDRVRFDNGATVALVLQDAPGGPGCSGKAIAQLIVHGHDDVSGAHFTLISQSASVGDGLCPESRVQAKLDVDADAASVRALRKSWGQIKVSYQK